ncbi:MAG TPA: M20/M25/M40 family metallo-hydrolase [Bacteroidota bacterium]|nr:M20/M25/M40 family metallo-hydrolase [Bacteroidota bacterium]
MKTSLLLLLALTCLLAATVPAQEKTDSAAIARIMDEGMNRSKIMDILSNMTDVYGPRLTWSPEHLQAAKWAVKQFGGWGLARPHLESGEPLGRGWTLQRYSANVIGKRNFPLISFPMAWSPGVEAAAEVVYLDATTDSALDTYRGKLGGKFVLLDPPRDVKAHFEPEATRDADSSLLDLANADDPANRRGGRRQRFEQTPEMKQRALVNYRKMQLLEKEGAAGILRISRGDGGNIFVGGASAAYHPDTPFTKRVGVHDPKAPKILPQVAVGAEHYNRLVRMIKKGEKPRLEMNLEVSFGKVDSLYNVIAEIPGTDLADEVVMLGGHFDSWHGGTGATDDATGCATAMEAVRILTALDLRPRRTIRVALWDGEEQGLNGSEAYVKAHFGSRQAQADGQGELKLLPEAEKFSVYFNHDNGTGKLRGVYLQGNEAARKIFRSWLAPFDSLGASTLSLANTGGTDHLSFDAIGLPGFQFIQDQIEYSTRTHHSTMDVYDRVQEADMKQAAVIMATFAYHAAMRDEKFPRKEMPKPRPQMPGSN